MKSNTIYIQNSSIQYNLKYYNKKYYNKQIKDFRTTLPSLGYICYTIIKNLHKDEKIYLVGFTFEGWEGHNFEYEKSFFNDNNISII